MAEPTLGGVTLSGCNSIDPNKTANVIPIPMPTQDSDKTEVFDMLGVVKIIAVRGTFAGANIAATKALVDSVEALVDGNQSVIQFISDQTGTINVMVMSISTHWEVPGFACTYDIKLIQGIQ